MILRRILITALLLISVNSFSIEENLHYFEAWYNSYNAGNYESAIINFERFINSTPIETENKKIARNNLKLSYRAQCDVFFEQKNWIKAKDYCIQAALLDEKEFIANYNAGAAYYNLGEYEKAYPYFKIALDNAKDFEDNALAKKSVADTVEKMEALALKQTAPSNDPLSYLQYYIKSLNVPAAWKKVTNSNEVVVAIIDDGVHINHPDLGGKIWVMPNAVYGASKIIDFVGDKIGSNLPTGEHGTMIAGIIWANINNGEWIAGIAKNVKFMPLRVFGFDDNASDESIIRAMNYAIDNWANIINLSLQGSQFANYSDKYDGVIKRAYEKGIVVVIAAGNGDVLSKSQIGIDLTVNPVSPVCNNNGNTTYSIGVAAHTKDGYRTPWTNYNWCIAFFTPGVWIVSTSIPLFGWEYGTNYNTANGTSFSAPMITGIIALGYNQYGYVSPKIVKESLSASLTKNAVWNLVVDASKYLDALGKKSDIIRQEQLSYNSRTSERKTIDVNSDGNVLASFGIVKQQDSEEAYNLNSNVLRQEVVGMAMKLWKFTLPENYACKKMFKDVSSLKPNNWICRAVEVGAENGVVSTANKSFNPESSITRAEALAILLKAAGIKIEESTTSKYSDVTVAWQKNLVNTAFSYSFIDDTEMFYPNKNATRGEIFNMAKRILKSQN